MIDKELIDPVLEPDSEKVHRLGRAVIGSVPVLGPAALEMFNSIIEPPLQARKSEWMIQVTDILNELLSKGVLTEQDLQQNEQFITTLIHASSSAIRNHENLKLEALTNIVMNSALPNSPNESLQQIFLNFVDTFTSWHIKFLMLYKDPKQWAAENNHTFPMLDAGSIEYVLELAFPELEGRFDFKKIIWLDLYRNGLVNTDGIATSMTEQGIYSKRTTQFGDSFLSFISKPNL